MTSYDSSGTSYSNFIVQAVPAGGTNYRIWSDHELAAELAKPPEPPFANGEHKRPFYIIGHNPNQIPIPGTHPANWTAEDEALGDLDAGANALEPDMMKFPDGARFIGGGPVSDNAGPSKLFVYHDAVLVTTHMSASVEQYFDYIHDLILNKKYKISLLSIDVKPQVYSSGPVLVKALHDHLFRDGVRPWIIYNCGDNNAESKKFFSDIAGLITDHEGMSIDGTRDPVGVFNMLAGVSKNHNIGYGTGGQGFTSGSFPHVSLSVDQATWMRTSAGLNASVPWVFPVPSAATAAGIDWWGSFMNAGVDGLIPDLDVNPAPPGSTRALIGALRKKIEASSNYYVATAADNPFGQGREGYALRVDTGHNLTSSAGTDGNVTFTLTGTKGTASAMFNGRTSVGSETRFHDNGRDYLVIPSKDLGKLTALTIYVSGAVSHSWTVKQVEISSAMYNIPFQDQTNVPVNQTVSTGSPVTLALQSLNLGKP